MKLSCCNHLFQLDQGCGRIANGKNQRNMQLCRTLHGNRRTCHAPLLCFSCHIRLRNKAMYLSAEFRQYFFIDAGLCHIGICHNMSAVLNGLQCLPYRMGRKHQVIRIIKIRCGVNDTLDHRRDFLWKLSVSQFLCNNLKAAFFNLRRLHIFHIHVLPLNSASCRNAPVIGMAHLFHFCHIIRQRKQLGRWIPTGQNQFQLFRPVFNQLQQMGFLHHT